MPGKQRDVEMITGLNALTPRRHVDEPIALVKPCQHVRTLLFHRAQGCGFVFDAVDPH